MTEKSIKEMHEIIKKFNEKTAIPSIVLTAERGENIAVTDSKFGGLPYLPKGFEYPKTSENQPLKLLAQLNFAQLPKLEHFPKEGILQFYVLPDDVVGLEETPIKQDTYRVIYHKEILPPHEQMTNFPKVVPFVDNSKYPHSEAWFPFEGKLLDGELLLKGKVEPCPMTLQTYEFEPTFFKFYTENATEPIKGQGEIRNFLWDRYLDEDFFKSQEGIHRISGYPLFTQDDPRPEGYETLLLQINSDYKFGRDWQIMWGDSGVANFFINLEDLKNLNFQDVMYTWDCC